jgi:hypothetical protein
MPKLMTLKHLGASLGYKSRSGKGGMCFLRATALVLDMPGAELCIGTFDGVKNLQEALAFPGATNGDLIHAWVENKGMVFAPSMISDTNKAFGPLDRALYYGENNARDVCRMTRAEVLKLSGQLGFSSYIRKGTALKNGGTVSVAVLIASGVKYVENADGTITPG